MSCGNCSSCSCSDSFEDDIKFLSVSELKKLAADLKKEITEQDNEESSFIESVKHLAAVYKQIEE